MKKMTAAIIIENNKILLIHNIKHGQHRIEPPGGKKEESETIEECVIREVKEELNVKIKILSLFGIYKTNSPEGNFDVSMFLSKIINGKIKLLENKTHSKFSWYRYNDLLKLKEKGLLVPNLTSSLKNLKPLLCKNP